MTEMKEKIYPELPSIRELPTAPDVVNGDQGHSYRLKIIREIQEFLEKEFKQREELNKKYLRIARLINVVDNGLLTITLIAETTASALSATGVDDSFGLTLTISGAVTAAVSLFGNFFCRKVTLKAMKHKEIRALASGNLRLIASHISKALIDNHISNEEFNLILEVLEKYKEVKEEIRSNTKKKITKEEEESLIEKGKQEATKSFRRLLEKDNTI